MLRKLPPVCVSPAILSIISGMAPKRLPPDTRKRDVVHSRDVFWEAQDAYAVQIVELHLLRVRKVSDV